MLPLGGNLAAATHQPSKNPRRCRKKFGYSVSMLIALIALSYA
jgi:hypothetical protein